ncbi:hypothetical protein SAY86_002454 [Trapa natans]|uniref:C2 domain-containing protein n=1 Tax=Trapa natans TaxID=22666 RepID=A0AAN7R2G7_TRANT|nr:hypothetical protein SAY86_002454 [Trapa natans]
MGKISVEVCLISARGLGQSSSLFGKTQWFAVGWIDPNDKYCTKIDAPGNGNPMWKTKFLSYIEGKGNGKELKDVDLQVEVYRRDPIFLGEKLQGTATIGLREFLAQPKNNEVNGTYQLRKRDSNKPRGFIDLSIRVFEGGEDPVSFSPGNYGGLMLMDGANSTALATLNGASSLTSTSTYESYPTGPTPLPLAAASHLQWQNRHQLKPEVELSYAHPTPIPPNFSNPSVGGPVYPRARGPSFLPPRPSLQLPFSLPSEGSHSHLRPFLPEYTNGAYINIPSSSTGPARRGAMGGYGAALGAGALGAGTVFVGEEIMSEYGVSSSFQDPTVNVYLDPPL